MFPRGTARGGNDVGSEKGMIPALVTNHPYLDHRTIVERSTLLAGYSTSEITHSRLVPLIDRCRIQRDLEIPTPLKHLTISLYTRNGSRVIHRHLSASFLFTSDTRHPFHCHQLLLSIPLEVNHSHQDVVKSYDIYIESGAHFISLS